MGSTVEVNDTLQITTAQGFPADILDLKRHRQKPITASDVAGRLFSFHDKPGARVFLRDPVRVYLVHNIDGKWLFWGRIFIQSQTISKKLDAAGNWSEDWVTSGTYEIVDIYEPDYQAQFTARETAVERI